MNRSWGLPLLAKELTAAAARPKTYRIRLIYAVVLLVVGYCVLVAASPGSRTLTLNSLGSGAPVLATLRVLQVIGLYLLLPVLAAGAVAIEKERQTLELLLITRLGPWTIVCEKFLGELVPALSFILLSLPLLAFSYALGGISPERVWITLIGLLLLAIRLAALGILCSCACRTTGKALLATYALIPVTCLVEQTLQGQLLPVVHRLIGSSSTLLNGGSGMESVLRDAGLFSLLSTNLILSLSDETPFWLRFAFGVLPSLAFSLLLLILARWVIVPPIYGWLGWLFRIRPGGPRRYRRPFVERQAPGEKPIAWREGPRGDLAYWWVKRVLLAVMLTLTLLLTPIVLIDASSEGCRAIVASVNFAIWFILALRISSSAAVLIVQERIHQTLDILCCTPLTGEEIVRQKMVQVWRLVWLGRISLGTCVAVRMFCAPSLGHLVLSGLLIWRLPQLIVWLAVRSGMAAKTGAGAIMRAILALTAWCAVPLVVCFFVAIAGAWPLMAIVGGCSPLFMLGVAEVFPISFAHPELVFFLIMAVFSSAIGTSVAIAFLQESVNRISDAYLRGIFDDILIMRLQNSRIGIPRLHDDAPSGTSTSVP